MRKNDEQTSIAVAEKEVAVVEKTAFIPLNLESSMEDDLLQSQNEVFTTLDTTIELEGKLLYNCLNSTGTLKLEDYLEKPIKLNNLIIQKFKNVDEESGELVINHRIILIDTENKCYSTGSKGIYNSIKKLLIGFGLPNTWQEAKTIRVIEKALDKGRKTYLIELV